jgi:hypothetical protein
MRSSPVALTGSTGSKTRTENVDIGRDTGAGRRETEKRKKEGRFRQDEREQTTRRLALAYIRPGIYTTTLHIHYFKANKHLFLPIYTCFHRY